MNDREAQDLYHSIVREYTASVYRYFCSWRLSPEEAEDLTQEAYLEAWKSLRSFRRESSPKTWLLKICRRVVWKYTQKRARRSQQLLQMQHEPLADSLTRGSQPFESPQQRHDEIDLLLSVLSALSREHQEMLHLRYLQGLTEREISEVLSTSQHTIHSRLGVARKKFRQLYREATEDLD